MGLKEQILWSMKDIKRKLKILIMKKKLTCLLHFSLFVNLTYLELGKLSFLVIKEFGFAWKKVKPEDIIVRNGSVSPANRKFFCIILLLLLVKEPTSFENSQTYEDEICGSFGEACVKYSLLENDDIWWKTLTGAHKETIGVMKFRKFFAMLIKHLDLDSYSTKCSIWWCQVWDFHQLRILFTFHNFNYNCNGLPDGRRASADQYDGSDSAHWEFVRKGSTSLKKIPDVGINCIIYAAFDGM